MVKHESAWIALKTKLRFLLRTLCVAMVFYTAPGVSAPSMTAQIPLSFGLLAVKSNAAIETLQLHMSGAVTASSNILAIGNATRGEYRLTGFPAGVLLEFSWDNAILSAGGGGLPEFLQVTNYENPTVATNALGEATIQLGASLKTSGNSVMYTDAPYSGTTQVRVRYWSEAAGGYLTYYGSVSFSAQLQSAINLVQDQALSFGSIAAYADPVLKASMILNTNGTITNVTAAGSARITPLSGAQAGVIRVTGAAPNCSVTITPEPGSVFMTHVTYGAGAARFIAKNFVTQPATSGFTDATGNLQIKIGATLETEATANSYANGTYSGTYTMTVSY